jgi:predicted chitinase
MKLGLGESEVERVREGIEGGENGNVERSLGYRSVNSI